MKQTKELKPNKLYIRRCDSPRFKNESIIKTLGKETIKGEWIRALVIKNKKFPGNNGMEFSFRIKPSEDAKVFELSQDEANILDVLS